jgi:hypothetical protein
MERKSTLDVNLMVVLFLSIYYISKKKNKKTRKNKISKSYKNLKSNMSTENIIGEIIATPKLTSKNRKCVVIMNYLYYHKRFNETSVTTNWVCSEEKCSASITTDSDFKVSKNVFYIKNVKYYSIDGLIKVIKLNGKKVVSVELVSESHPTHQPLNDIDLLCMDFKQQLKEKVKDGSKSIREHYNDAQTEFIKSIGNDVEKAAEFLPQLPSIKTRLHQSLYRRLKNECKLAQEYQADPKLSKWLKKKVHDYSKDK